MMNKMRMNRNRISASHLEVERHEIDKLRILERRKKMRSRAKVITQTPNQNP